MTADASHRRPGRPSQRGAEAVRQDLIEAARALCVEVGLDAATARAIGRRAGVNPAMINYYFDSKEGLVQAMMRESMQPVLTALDAALAAAASGGISLEAFVGGYMRALSRHPWLPQLVVREVLPANGRFRELFFAELAPRAGRLLQALVAPGAAAAVPGSEPNPKLAALSIMSIAVFPFLAAPVVERVLGLQPTDPQFADELIDHSTRVLRRALTMEVAQ